MVEMTNEEANNYSLILKALGMEEEGDPVSAIDFMLETLRGIADADWRKWEELASPEEFVRWAKARANHALIGPSAIRVPNAKVSRGGTDHD